MNQIDPSPPAIDDDAPHPAEDFAAPRPPNPMNFDVATERLVLGAMMLGSAGELLDISPPEAFHVPAHVRIARAIAGLEEQGAPTDPLAVWRALPAQTRESLEGGALYLTNCTEQVPARAVAAYHAREVAALASDRAMADAALGALQALQEGRREAAGDLLRGAVDAPIAGPFSLEQMDFVARIAEGVPEPEYLLEPWVPVGHRILVTGESFAGKSMWAMWVAATLSREGRKVAYFSQENPELVDLRRLERLNPDPENFIFYFDQGLDLASREHSGELLRACKGIDLVVLDTLTAVWSGDENDNGEMKDLIDRRIVKELMRGGSAVMILDHTGNPQMVRRGGVNTSRGASAKTQAVDSNLVLKTKPKGFLLTETKNRCGRPNAEPKQFEITDLEDGSLDIVEVAVEASTEKQETCADDIVAILRDEGVPMSENAIREKLATAEYGRRTQVAAFAQLRAEDPPRAVCERGGYDKAGRKSKTVNSWRIVTKNLFDPGDEVSAAEQAVVDGFS